MAKKNQNPQSNQNLNQPGESENKPSNEKFFYGNKDADKKFQLRNDWKKSVVVYQCKVEVMNGGMVEVPNTHQLQTYTPEMFDKLNEGDKKKDIPPFFSESKMKVLVLHDPRLEE